MEDKNRKIGHTTEAQRRATKKYRDTHRDKVIGRSRAYAASHKEETRAYKAANREKINASKRVWAGKNKERLREKGRLYRERYPERIQESKFKVRYGISTREYLELLEKQNGGCAICGTKTPGGRAKKHFFVDHDHKTNKVRGLLCNDHNLMLGRAQDTPETLERGAAYLRRHLGQ